MNKPSILAVELQSRADVYLAVSTVIICIALMWLYNWQTTRKSKRGYQRFINWTSAQRDEARRYQAERRRRPSAVAAETSKRARAWMAARRVPGVVAAGSGGLALITTGHLKWAAVAIFAVSAFVGTVLVVVGISLEFKAVKQQREYEELQLDDGGNGQVAGADAVTTLKVMTDYQCSPLWLSSPDDVGNPDPHDYPSD